MKTQKQDLQRDLDDLAAAIKKAIQSADMLYARGNAIKDELNSINTCLLVASNFNFPSKATKEKLAKLYAHIDDLRHLINRMELGAFGLQVKQDMDALWKELP